MPTLEDYFKLISYKLCKLVAFSQKLRVNVEIFLSEKFQILFNPTIPLVLCLASFMFSRN